MRFILVLLVLVVVAGCGGAPSSSISEGTRGDTDVVIETPPPAPPGW